MKMKMELIVVIGLSIFLITTACPKPEQPLDRVTIHMKWIFNGTVSEFFYGQQKKVFRDKGISLDIEPGGPGISGVSLVAGGSSTFAVSSAEEVIKARAKGIPVKAIIAIFQRNPVIFVAKPGIDKPSLFRGKRAALVVGDNTELQFNELIENAGIDREEMEIVPWTFDLGQLVSGAIDLAPAYAFDQPLQLRRIDPEFKFETIEPNDVVAMGDVIITTEENIQKNSDLVMRFTEAFLKSLSDAIENPEDAVDALIHKNSDLSKDKELETWKEAIKYVRSNENRIGLLNRKKWAATLERIKKYGTVELDDKYPIDDCFTNNYVQQISMSTKN